MSRLLIAALTCFLWGSVVAAEPDPDPLFASSDIIDITLTGPFRTIDNERNKDNEYEGSLSYTDASGNEVVLDAGFTVRGNWRLDKGNCNYSQLWVNLRRSQLEGTLFENQNRLKLVVQCRRQDRYADYLHQELQLYQVFSELSEYHFDTRLVNVTYADTERENYTRTHHAFFIEHQNRLADRFDFQEVEDHSIRNLDLNPLQSTIVSLFMYFIGNTDFSIIEGPTGEECCHNSKLILSEAGDYYPVPYDFDASGYVDASYAPEPNPQFNLRSNRSRLYRGFCVEDDVLTAAVDRFQQKRERIMEMVNDTSTISERTARRTAGFVEDFYETLDDERDFDRGIIRRCRG